MNILGVSANFHDSSAALIVDKQLVAAAAEERFTLTKHDPNFPAFAIDFCLSKARINHSELDAVVFYENSEKKFSRILKSNFSRFPHSRSQFADLAASWLSSKLWTKTALAKKLNLNSAQVFSCEHHESHAEYAFSTSQFNEAAILVVDGVGEWDSTSLYFASDTVLTKLEAIEYPNSLGLVYSTFTAFLGLKVNESECSTMAIAAFGKPKYADLIRLHLIRAQSDGTYEIDNAYFNFEGEYGLPFNQAFISLFGEPRKQKLNLDIYSLSKIDEETQRFADIAASIQLVLEERLIALCERLKRLTGATKLCFTGGVALNCVAVARIANSNIFDEIYVPTNPGDGGSAVGAAVFRLKHHNKANKVILTDSPFLGSEDDERAVINMIPHLKPHLWANFQELHPTPFNKICVNKFADFDALAGMVVDRLKMGQIVGWFQGNFEFGPRALGNRSILCCPSRLESIHRLNSKVKLREAYRPYALSMADSFSHLSLKNSMPSGLRFMQSTSPINDQFYEDLKGASHIDRTTRPQICFKKDNPTFHRLLVLFSEATGIPGLLNTSLNESDSPIVATAVQALLMFVRTDIDALVLNGRMLLTKK